MIISQIKSRQDRGSNNPKYVGGGEGDVTLQGSNLVSCVAGNHSWPDSIRLASHTVAHDDEPLVGQGRL
jgi:hypothetical protein